MKNLRIPTIRDLAEGLLAGDLPFPVALKTWRAANGLRQEDVSAMIGRQPTACASCAADPERVPRVREAIEELIGYRPRRNSEKSSNSA